MAFQVGNDCGDCVIDGNRECLQYINLDIYFIYSHSFSWLMIGNALFGWEWGITHKWMSLWLDHKLSQKIPRNEYCSSWCAHRWEPHGTTELSKTSISKVDSVPESFIGNLEAVNCDMTLQGHVTTFFASNAVKRFSNAMGKLCDWDKECRLQKDANNDLKYQNRRPCKVLVQQGY